MLEPGAVGQNRSIFVVNALKALSEVECIILTFSAA
jgi:hypothetical protein